MTADHEQLAEDLITLVEREHEALRKFNIEDYTRLAEERVSLSREVIALAEVEPIPAEQAEQYRWVQTFAEDNFKLLQDAQQVMQGIIKRLTGNTQSASTYNKAGNRSSYQSSESNGVMVWKG